MSREYVVFLRTIREGVLETRVNCHKEDGVLGDLANAGVLLKKGVPTLRVDDELDAIILVVLVARAWASVEVGVGIGRRDLGTKLHVRAAQSERARHTLSMREGCKAAFGPLLARLES